MTRDAKTAVRLTTYAVVIWTMVLASRNLSGQIRTDLGRDTAVEVSFKDQSGENDDILDLDLDQLGNVDAVVPAFDVAVTSVTKSDSTVGKSPAAIFVVTQEMIRRSGATSIPEILRMVPGVQVAQIDSNKWAVTARGFNGRFANKLLVMVDGRSVYNALFGGVYWESLDVILEDIDRVELIRGPGATMWGANAVNGVVNIITKDSSETQGVLVSSGGGTHDKSINLMRVGGELREGVTYRVFAKQFERERGFALAGSNDDWRMNRIGMRIDGDLGTGDQFMLQGDLYEGAAGERGLVAQPGFPFEQQYIGDTELAGGQMTGRLSRKHSQESSSILQFYYDKTMRDGKIAEARIDVFDLDFSHRFRLTSKQMLNWGLGYRRHQDFVPTNDPFNFGFTPTGRKLNRTSGFVQDEITIREDLIGYVGSKFSHNDFTGFEVQPSGKLLWAISDRKVAWTSVSRAVRTPSRINDVRIITYGAPFLQEISGNPNPESENLTAYELGYRQQMNERFAWDVALFFNHFTDLREQVLQGVTPGIPPIVNVAFESVGQAKTMGVEYSANLNLSENWTLNGWYSFLDNRDTLSAPRNQAYLASSLNLPRCWELDVMTRYTDTLPEQNIDAYIDLDIRLGWRPSRKFELSIVGQNMLDSSRPEFGGTETGSLPTEVRRGVFGQLSWRY